MLRADGGLVLISPIAFTVEQLSKIKSYGTVTDIVAPNLFHHLHVVNSMRAFPKAQVWGPRGAREKLPHIKWTKILGVDSWTPSVEHLTVEGMPNFNESVFLKDRTLVVSDLCFNLLKPRGWAAPIFLSLFGTYKKFNVSRLFMRSIKDRHAFRESMGRLLAKDFDRIVMAHGEVVESGGKALLAQALKGRGLAPQDSVTI